MKKVENTFWKLFPHSFVVATRVNLYALSAMLMLPIVDNCGFKTSNDLIATYTKNETRSHF